MHGDFNGSKNTSVALTGKLRFVKEGTGVFYAQKAGQSYTGGTEIRGGTVYFGTGTSPLGPKNSEIKIAAGAMLDMNGIISTCYIDVSKRSIFGNGTKVIARSMGVRSENFQSSSVSGGAGFSAFRGFISRCTSVGYAGGQSFLAPDSEDMIK